MKKGEVFGKICKDCKLLHKHAVCAKCHDFWVMKYETMYKSQASANGKNGALQAKVNIAEAKLKAISKGLCITRDRNAMLSNEIVKAVVMIQKVGRFGKKKALQDIWHTLTPLIIIPEPKK